MSSYKIEGIVIKRSNFGEAGRLVTLFTRHHGKVTFKAVGVRKTTSKRSGSLELFNHVFAVVIRGKGDLDIIAEVQAINTFASWRKYLGRVTLAYQLVETVDKLTPDREPHVQIFEILLNSLSGISQLGPDWELNIKHWTLDILSELGYWDKDREFKGDLHKFIEDIAQRPLHSQKLLTKLR